MNQRRSLCAMVGVVAFLSFYNLVDYPHWAASSAFVSGLVPVSFAPPLLVMSLVAVRLHRFSGRVALGVFGLSAIVGIAGAGVASASDAPWAAWLVPLLLLPLAIGLGFSAVVQTLAGMDEAQGGWFLLVGTGIQSLVQLALSVTGLAGSLSLLALFAIVAFGAFWWALASDEWRASKRPMPWTALLRSTSPLAVCLFIIAFSEGCGYVIMFNVMPETAQAVYIPAVGRLVACAVLSILWYAARPLLRGRKMAMGLLAFVILEFALCPVFARAASDLFMIAGNVIMSATMLLCLLLVIELVRNRLVGALSGSCLVLTVMYSGALAGDAVARLVRDAVGFDATGVFCIAICVVSALGLVGTLLGLRPERETHASIGAQRPAGLGDTVEAELVGEGEFSSFADEFGLTPREAEVFAMLMRGNSVLGIADKLCISDNTVKGHMKNIYAKTGVHSRQELVDAVENVGRTSR